jgi:putative transposase
MLKQAHSSGVGPRRYATDLTDEQWALIEPMLPPAKPGGRPRTTDLRRVVDAILYVLTTGCQWRNLPHEFPAWGTCYYYFSTWQKSGFSTRLMGRLVKKVRVAEGHDPKPNIASIDSQSVKTGKYATAGRGYDGGKRVKGRKRHLLVDELGLPIAIAVTAANTHDKVGGEKVLERAAKVLRGKGLKELHADGGYRGAPFRKLVRRFIKAKTKILGNIAQKTKCFVPLPERWKAERSFGWLKNSRRLAEDQERLPRTSRAMISWAFIRLTLNRLAGQLPTPWQPRQKPRLIGLLGLTRKPIRRLPPLTWLRAITN